MTAEQIWERISNSVDDYLVNDVPNITTALLLNAFPGAGKTRNVLRRIYELGKKFIYLASEHEVIEENVTLHDDVDFNFIHFRSRERECQNPEFHELAQMWRMSLRPLCDKVCTDRETCPYYVNKKIIEERNPPSWAGVHSHIITFLGKYLRGTPAERGHLADFDVLVLEESPIPRLMENRVLSLEDMGNVESEASQMQECHEDQLGMFCDMIEYFAAHIAIPHNYNRLWGKVQEWRDWDTPSWAKFHDKWEEHITMRVMGTDGAEPLRNVPPDIIMLLNDMFQTTTRENLERHVQTIANRISLSYFYGDTLHDLPIRTIGLDGTANIDTWGRILGKPIHTVNIAKPFKNVWQLKGGNYPQSSWIYEGELRDTGLQLLKLVEKIAKTREGKVLLIGTKKVCTFADQYFKEKHLEKKVRIAHYYSLRSKNFVDCDSVVLLVRPSPPQNSMETYTALSGWPMEVWHNYYTREEMLQAIARIRPNLEYEITDRNVFPPRRRIRGNIECFVLCNAGRRGEPEELFNMNDIVEGTYHRESVSTIEGYIMTGMLLPQSKGDVKREEWMSALLEHGSATQKELVEHVKTKWKSATKRNVVAILDRMRLFNKVTVRGDVYELATRPDRQHEEEPNNQRQ
jgi:hypothetical protein